MSPLQHRPGFLVSLEALGRQGLRGNSRLGNFNHIIYPLANTQYATAGFHDVANGNNGFNGVAGFNDGAQEPEGIGMLGSCELSCPR